MKTYLLLGTLLLTTACASGPNVAVQQTSQELALANENDALCENHKSDFQYFRAAFDKEHAEICSGGCEYSASMVKNSDTMERVAGLYYLMNCDANHGRL